MIDTNQTLDLDQAKNSLLSFIEGFKKDLIQEIKLALLSEATQSKEVNPLENEILTRQEAAHLLNCSLTTLCQYQKEGVIPFYKIGKKVLFRREELLISIRRHVKKGGVK